MTLIRSDLPPKREYLVAVILARVFCSRSGLPRYGLCVPGARYDSLVYPLLCIRIRRRHKVRNVHKTVTTRINNWCYIRLTKQPFVRFLFLFLQGKKECEERTRKKAEKRKRKEAEKRKKKEQAKEESGAKQAKTDARAKGSSSISSSGGGKNGGGASSSSDGDAAEEFVYIPEADQAASGGDGGAPAAYKNDGSFLEKMKKELELAGSRDGIGASPGGGGGGGSRAVAAK